MSRYKFEYCAIGRYQGLTLFAHVSLSSSSWRKQPRTFLFPAELHDIVSSRGCEFSSHTDNEQRNVDHREVRAEQSGERKASPRRGENIDIPIFFNTLNDVSAHSMIRLSAGSGTLFERFEDFLAMWMTMARLTESDGRSRFFSVRLT